MDQPMTHPIDWSSDVWFYSPSLDNNPSMIVYLIGAKILLS